MEKRIYSIFRDYFNWLEKYFGNLANEAYKTNSSPRDIAADFLSKESRRESFQRIGMPAIMSFIDSFWASNYKEVMEIITLLPGLQARFGGDIGPQAHLGIIQRSGLYFDTIIVPDPLLRVSKIEDTITKHKGFYLLKYVINQILLKDFYLSNAYPPIAILTADTELARPDIGFSEISEIARLDTVIFLNELFEESLDSFDGAHKFMSKFDTVDNMVSVIAKPEILLFDDQIPLNPKEQIEGLIDHGITEVDPASLVIPIDSPQYVLFSIVGRFMQSNDVFVRSSEHYAHPLISAPVSYHWLTTKFRLNKEAFSEHLGLTDPLDLSLTNSLLSRKLKWLSNIPPATLVQLRENGELSNLRSIISTQVKEFSSPNLDNIEKVANNVDLAISTALQNHQDQIMSLDKKFRQDLSIKIPTLLSSVLISIQPSFLPITPSLVRTAGVILGSTNVLSLFDKIASYIRERKELNRQPIAFLWDAKNE